MTGDRLPVYPIDLALVRSRVTQWKRRALAILRTGGEVRIYPDTTEAGNDHGRAPLMVFHKLERERLIERRAFGKVASFVLTEAGKTLAATQALEGEGDD